MRVVKLPDAFDIIIELSPSEWEETRVGLNTDLILRRNENTVIARAGGAWILFIIKEGVGND